MDFLISFHVYGLYLWLFNNNRNAFDISMQFFIRAFNAFLKCVASAHLMYTLNTNFVGPSIGVLQLFFLRQIMEKRMKS